MNKVKLGDCIELIIDNRGKTPPLAETGYELIETVSINGSNKYPDYSKITKFVSEETYNTWFRKGHPTSGDILISTVGMNIGDVVIMKSNRGSIAQNLIALRTNNKLNSDYLYYILTSKNIREKIRSLNIGSAQPSLKVPHLLNIEFYLPNIEKQSEISKILNELDEKIELNTQINQTLEQIAQTIFKSWFIDFDPVHAKANALASGQTAEQATQAAMAVISGKNTQELHRLQTANPEQYQQLWEIADAFPSGFSGYKNLGEIPIGWNVLTFKDFISESKEKIGSLEDVPEYSVGNEGIYPRSEKYNKSLSKTPEKNKVVRIGDLVFGMGSKTLNWGIMNDEIGSVSPAYFVYRIFTNINYIYLNKYIKAKEYDFQNLIKPTSRQGQSVDKEMFLKKEIYVPNEYLLNIYLNKLKEIDSLVYSYTTEVLILEQIRDELLPKLLSGEI
ncbi:restriction endonuclease subunit S [Glaesserella parasuis]|uniref:restriction endonuclease subunit S n=1 Tax=Glaesserella parasuis TaxID=738 RepID=UPI002436FAEC|nr:restriction endonuclease subunit S [Glaesserella parasuis]MDG6775907.1 restriction endonuclease subunit S [Glaesserella parasuis]MDO9919908.1 restriction endonuclease subunit S [Glaesserella parasuis]MDP0032752.1 restriction endonuclease subunit S [Glaesserella parasuis]MDP0196463.1 restriction endonuclease subunit S [Glaesserella parasuis]MDP0198664.1 restriction endonuclease subunit S [Glaesserella parasuis]